MNQYRIYKNYYGWNNLCSSAPLLTWYTYCERGVPPLHIRRQQFAKTSACHTSCSLWQALRQQDHRASDLSLILQRKFHELGWEKQEFNKTPSKLLLTSFTLKDKNLKRQTVIAYSKTSEAQMSVGVTIRMQKGNVTSLCHYLRSSNRSVGRSNANNFINSIPLKIQKRIITKIPYLLKIFVSF